MCPRSTRCSLLRFVPQEHQHNHKIAAAEAVTVQVHLTHLWLSLFVCSLQRHLRLGCPRMDTSFKKWVSPTPSRTLECSRQYIFSSFEPITKGALHFVIPRLPVMHHCAVVWSRRTEERLSASHCTAINNELFSACYDNGGFITVKPRRSTQLVCAAQAGGT